MKQLDKILEDFSTAKNFRKPLELKWLNWYKYYRAYRKSKPYPWRSNIFVPYAFSTIESTLPIMVANRPRFQAEAQNLESEVKSKVMEQLINYQYEKLKMFPTIVDYAKTALLYGTGIMKVYWKFSKDTGYDDPCMEAVDIFDFFIDPNATSVKSSRYVIHRRYVTKEYIKEAYNKDISNTKKDTSLRDRLSVTGLNEDSADGKIELLEHWTDKTLTVVAEDKIIRKVDNPYNRKPFFEFCPVPVPHEFYGIAELEQVESLLWELNDTRNQRMDRANQVLNGMTLVSRTANVDADTLSSRPSGVIYTDEMEGIREYNRSEVPISGYKEEQEIKNDIQTATAVSEYTRGGQTSASGGETATSVIRRQEGAFARFDLQLALFETCLSEIGDFIKDIDLMFIDRDRVMRIVGKEGVEFAQITPEEIQGDFDIRIVKGSTLPTSQAIKQQQMLNLYNLFSANPLINQQRLIEEVLKTYKIDDITNWLQPMQPPPMRGNPQIPGNNMPQANNEADILRQLANQGGKLAG